MELKNLLAGALLLLSGIAANQAMAAEDCPGVPWVDYGIEVNGGACAHMGLDTHRGVCRPGDRFETLCDDRRGNRGQTQYKTCQGPRPCGGAVNDYSRHECEVASSGHGSGTTVATPDSVN